MRNFFLAKIRERSMRLSGGSRPESVPRDHWSTHCQVPYHSEAGQRITRAPLFDFHFEKAFDRRIMLAAF